MLFFALLLLVVPVESAGQNGELAKLTEVKIVVEDLSLDARMLALNEYEIKNQVVVFLQSKLPRLKVNESAEDSIYVNAHLEIDTTEGVKADFFGAIMVKVWRRVFIFKPEKITSAIVYNTWAILTGPLNDARGFSQKSLD